MAIRSGSVCAGNGEIPRASSTNPNFENLQADSKDAGSFETDMTLMQALRLYKKAIAWSLLLSLAGVMEGYDLDLLGNFYSLPQFQDRFGTETLPDGTRNIPASWRTGLNNGALIGGVLGLMATGVLQDRYGYKRTIGLALSCLIGFIFVLFFAQNIAMLMAGEILCGLCWGVFQTITTAYASEVTPVRLRGYLTTYVNLCWVFGLLIGSGVLRSMLNREDEWAYRIPFAIQWVWPIPILVGCILCPESPWWLVRKGRPGDAKLALLRLTSPGPDAGFNADKTIAMMCYTNQMEKELTQGTSYLDCFKGVNLRRTEVVCFTWLAQVFCGCYLTGYSTTFFVQAGLPKDVSFNLSIAQSAMGVLGTIGSWFLMSCAGRRTIYLYGSASICVVMLIIGLLGTAKDNANAQWSVGALLLLFAFIYDLTVGPVCYSLVAELSSTRLKAKTIVLARITYSIGGNIASVVINYQLTPSAWNWGAYSGFFWSATCMVSTVWIFFRLPEPKGRTYGELDVLFENKISTRKFAETGVCLTNDFSGEGRNTIDIIEERNLSDKEHAEELKEV